MRRKILENNVLASHWLIGFVAPQMLERKDGSIIIVSSIGGLRGSPVLGAYCVSKAAGLQMARNLAVEYGPSNVRVNWPEPIRSDPCERTPARNNSRSTRFARLKLLSCDSQPSGLPLAAGKQTFADGRRKRPLIFRRLRTLASCHSTRGLFS